MHSSLSGYGHNGQIYGQALCDIGRSDIGGLPSRGVRGDESKCCLKSIGLGLGLFLFTHMLNLAKRLQDHSRKTDVYWGWVKGRARNLGLHE